MKIKKFSKINEGQFDEWFADKKPKVTRMITTTNPISMEITFDQDFEKIEYLFDKYHIKYKVEIPVLSN